MDRLVPDLRNAHDWPLAKNDGFLVACRYRSPTVGEVIGRVRERERPI